MSDADSPFEGPIHLPVEDHLDLHPFQPKDIPSVLAEYLEQSRRAGFHQVRIIHGKGKGVQRAIVHSWLGKHTAVGSFHDAPLEVGGWGATVVVLKVVG